MVGGRYELREELGSGGMATVWLAWDTRLNRKVAVKLLANVLAADRKFVARFEREAQLAAGLAHPNIVTVFDYGTDEDTPYIVMEAVEGESLTSRIRREGRLDEANTRRVCDSVLAALEIAHRNGIVHRDIKPSNILLGVDGSVKVADFGIARLTSDATQLTDTGVMMGTVAYLSPEQCAGAAASERSDIYGLGCVAYECLTGRPPFIGETPASVMYQHQHVEPQSPRAHLPELSAAMDRSVMTALAKRPEDRYQSAQSMRIAVSSGQSQPLATQAFNRSPDQATIPLAQPKVEGWWHRPTWREIAFVGTAFVVLAAIAGGIIYVATASKSPSKSNPALTTGGASHRSSGSTTTSVSSTIGDKHYILDPRNLSQCCGDSDSRVLSDQLRRWVTNEFGTWHSKCVRAKRHERFLRGVFA